MDRRREEAFSFSGELEKAQAGLTNKSRHDLNCFLSAAAARQEERSDKLSSMPDSAKIKALVPDSALVAIAKGHPVEFNGDKYFEGITELEAENVRKILFLVSSGYVSLPKAIDSLKFDEVESQAMEGVGRLKTG